jgi:hypothetical protein
MEQELETAFKNATKSRIFEREFTTLRASAIANGDVCGKIEVIIEGD